MLQQKIVAVRAHKQPVDHGPDDMVMRKLWASVTKASWEDADRYAAELFARGYVVGFLDRASDVLPAGISHMVTVPKARQLEDLWDISSLRDTDPLYDQFLVLAKIYSLIIPDPDESRTPKLLLTHRTHRWGADTIDIIYISDQQKMFINTFFGLAKHSYGTMCVAGAPDCLAMVVNAELGMFTVDRPESPFFDERTFVCSSNGLAQANTVLLKEDGLFIVHKEASGEGYERLSGELAWLRTRSKEMKRYFPAVLTYHDDPVSRTVWYRTRYYPWTDLKKVLFWDLYPGSSYTLDPDENKMRYTGSGALFGHILRIYAGLQEVLYATRKPVPVDHFEVQHEQKVLDRLAQVGSSYLQRFFGAETITVNGTDLLGVKPMMGLIKKLNAVTGILTPPFLSDVHGDLNITNILLDPWSELGLIPGTDLFLIDPRGGSSTQDPLYDLAQLFQRFWCDFDLIQEELVVAYERRGDSAAFPSVRICAAEELDDEYFNEAAVTNYAYMKEHASRFLEGTDRLFGLEQGEDWKVRLIFTMASITLASIKYVHGSHNGEEKAFTTFIRGLVELNHAFGLMLQRAKLTHPDILDVLLG